jgi:2-oxo-3-hexenedioate decarboxylase
MSEQISGTKSAPAGGSAPAGRGNLVSSLAQELLTAYADRQVIASPSSRDGSFDLPAAYAVEAELVRLRRANGRTTVGRKVGFANKALWRVLKLDTLVWAHMYDDTVRYAEDNIATLAVGRLCAPRIEPEIVFRMKQPVAAAADAVDVLAAVDWIALGFEVIDCVFADWKFQPADFVASFGLHAALVVGEPRPVDPGMIPTLAEQLPRFKVRLLKNEHLVEEGSGRNSLRSPALCLGELAAAISRQSSGEPLAAGELVSSGTLTESHPITAAETWTAVVDGIDLPPLTLHTIAG